MLIVVNSEPNPTKTVSLDELTLGLTRLGYSNLRICSLRQVDPEAFAAQRVLAIIYSGSGALWTEYEEADFEPTRQLLNAPPCPVLGICGGHQLFGKVLGAECGPMSCSKPLDACWTHADCEEESGFCKVFVRIQGILFTGLGGTIRVLESHFEELKHLPPGFIATAWNLRVQVQAMRHRILPIFGTQFHPERFTDEFPDGARVLSNFIQYAQATS